MTEPEFNTLLRAAIEKRLAEDGIEYEGYEHHEAIVNFMISIFKHNVEIELRKLRELLQILQQLPFKSGGLVSARDENQILHAIKAKMFAESKEKP